MNIATLRTTAVAATLGIALATCGAAALTSASATEQAAPEAETTEVVAYEGSLTADDIEMYCGMCHFTNVENQNISTFNVQTCDRAMVESMVPMLDDETIDDLTAYFAAIPAPEME